MKKRCFIIYETFKDLKSRSLRGKTIKENANGLNLSSKPVRYQLTKPNNCDFTDIN